MKNKLFLGSESVSRQQLLKKANIPFTVVGHTADERACDHNKPFQELLESIAIAKMDHVSIPECNNGAISFVLTADTMGMDGNGVVHGKPLDYADARKKIQSLRIPGGFVATAFCLDRKRYEDESWVTEQRVVRCVKAGYTFDMPDHLIDEYFKQQPDYCSFSGAINIEGFAEQFLQSINGSYTTIIGLPMFELRQELERIGFYSENS